MDNAFMKIGLTAKFQFTLRLKFPGNYFSVYTFEIH